MGKRGKTPNPLAPPSPPSPPRSLVLDDYESSASRYSALSTLVMCSITWFGDWELKLGIQSGTYEYKICGGWVFQSAPWMKKFFEEAFKRKAEATKAGNKALAQVWKIIINSAYGFYGIRVEDKDSVLIQEKGEL